MTEPEQPTTAPASAAPQAAPGWYDGRYWTGDQWSDIPAPQPTAKKKIPVQWVAIALAAVIAVGVILAVALTRGGGGSDGFTVTGEVALRDNDSSPSIGQTESKGCFGTGGYNDLGPGAQVTVSDASGTQLALGELKSGQRTNTSECVFDFEVKGVPAGENIYQVEVTSRGTVSFDEGEMRAGPALTIGD